MNERNMYTSSSGNSFFDGIRDLRFYRAHPRMLGGVCAGLAHRTGWSLALIRVLALISILAFGSGIAVYIILWILLPEGASGEIIAEDWVRRGRGGEFLFFPILLLAFLAMMLFGVGFFRSVIVLALLSLILIVVYASRGNDSGRRDDYGPYRENKRPGQPWQQTRPSDEEIDGYAAPFVKPSGSSAFVGSEDYRAQDTTGTEAENGSASSDERSGDTSAESAPQGASESYSDPSESYQAESYASPTPGPEDPEEGLYFRHSKPQAKVSRRPSRPAPSARFSLLLLALIFAGIGGGIMVGTAYDSALLGYLFMVPVTMLLLGGALIIQGVRGHRGGWISIVSWLFVPFLVLTSMLGVNISEPGIGYLGAPIYLQYTNAEPLKAEMLFGKMDVPVPENLPLHYRVKADWGKIDFSKVPANFKVTELTAGRVSQKSTNSISGQNLYLEATTGDPAKAEQYPLVEINIRGGMVDLINDGNWKLKEAEETRREMLKQRDRVATTPEASSTTESSPTIEGTKE
ncbi:hypothetical protein BSR29_07640 [Boudabousia liubingyangii]|uniref:Phage shock protein PspC N-terminal domain-containing protein n=1 Tax=Boudabousia liubingyangii TaxID=1921764 RepID=A0A1Q5PJK6_9ACTO|nr:PspC domain-containing protein [Boudabousia liubingyangii]OKL46120.1 hypothetical protein BSR29_07640 [Boudabousia liubingyangii]